MSNPDLVRLRNVGIVPLGMKHKLLIAFLLLFFASGANAQQRILDSLAVKDVPARAPGIATAIFRNGDVIFKQVAGYADLTDSVLIGEQTRFNIASNGKQFTALAVLMLVERGEMALSDDIRRFFPNLYPDIKDPITIRDLLNHTSGIRDVYDLWSLMGLTWWEQSFSNSDVLKLIERQQDLNFRPASRKLYSNSNYILLAMIIEKVTGRSFVDVTNEMFRALNMPNSSFVDERNPARGPIAKSYFNFGTWTTYDWIWTVNGDGNFFSTLEDQIQWERLVQANRIIAKSQFPIEGSAFPEYGYGLEFGTYRGKDVRFHEGATGAWKASVMRFPDESLSFITMTNSGKAVPFSQTRQMVDAVFGWSEKDDGWLTSPAYMGPFLNEDEVVGTYLTDQYFAFFVEKRESILFLKRIGRNDIELKRESDNLFVQRFDPAFKLEFRNDSLTAYHTDHAPYTLKRVGKIDAGFDPSSRNGQFLNLETDTSIRIEHTSGNEYKVTFRGEYVTKGILISESKMLVDFHTLEFSEDHLFLQSGRIRDVRFVRLN